MKTTRTQMNDIKVFTQCQHPTEKTVGSFAQNIKTGKITKVYNSCFDLFQSEEYRKL